MYDFQNAETGLWGPKDKDTQELLMLDVDNTYSIVKKYRDNRGNGIYEEFPLRYADKLFKSTLEVLKKPIPHEDDLSWVHKWNLIQAKGIKLLLAFLWEDASAENKEEAKKAIGNFINESFDKYYVEKDGAFSYYPYSEHTTVDGMSNMILKRIGALSYERQKRYWGKPEENAKNLGNITVIESIKEHHLGAIKNMPDINSWHIYASPPDFKMLYNNVWAVVYPKENSVLDITELVPNIVQWTESSSLSTGNWKSLANIKNEYASINIKRPLIYKEEFPYNDVNDMLKENTEIYIIGFDILQIPRFTVRINQIQK